MTQFDKLLMRILSLDKNMRFEELRKILEIYGYSMSAPGNGSSHATFRKPGHPPITIPRHNPIKKTYIILVKEAVESEVTDEKDS